MRDKLEQQEITAIYNRNAPLFDLIDAPMEAIFFRPWRPLLFRDLHGKVLEVGVGTGRNFPFYPPPEQAQVTAIDVAEKMLARARARSARRRLAVELLLADVQELPFADGTFDAVVGATVFCSVADPIRGLQEIYRVLAPGKEVRLLEHQRPPNPLLGRLFDRLDPLVVRLSGANINRTTDANVVRAGFTEVTSRALGPFGVVRLISGRKPRSGFAQRVAAPKETHEVRTPPVGDEKP